MRIINFLNEPGIFTFILVLTIIVALVLKTSAITLGGILLIIGAWYVYAGNVFFSIINYTLADACWLHNAYYNGDYLGAITVTIGIITGLIVTNKMRMGEFRKSIRKDDAK